MSNTQQYGYSLSQNHHGQGGASCQQQQSNCNQSTTNGKRKTKSLWDIGIRLERKVASEGTTAYQPQQTPQGRREGLMVAKGTIYQPQQTPQRTGGQLSQPTAPQPPTLAQGCHPGGYGLKHQAMNVAQPQQAVSNPQGHQQYRFRTPMTPRNQRPQAGNMLGSVGVGRGAPSFGSGVGTHFSNQPLEGVGSQAAAKGNLSATAEPYF